MKKITLFLLLISASLSMNAQCIAGGAYGTLTAANDGTVEQIDGCNYTGEYSEVSNLVMGNDYTFTCEEGGVPKYITVTDVTDVVIAFGPSPLVVSGITATDVRAHYTDDAACATTSNCHVTTLQCTSASCSPPPPPVNDICTGAIAVICGSTTSGATNTGATDTGGNAAADMWYSFTGAGVAELVTLDLCASSYDTMIRVFDACAGTEITNNDDSCGSRSLANFTSDGTTTYYIMVEGYGSNTGDYELAVTCAPAVAAPGNDMCANATALTLGTVLMGETSAGAAENLADEKPSCDNFGTIADVWYTFVAPASGDVTAMTTISGSSSEANIVIYNNTVVCGAVLAAAQVGCSDVGGSETLIVTGLTGGDTYTVRVWTDGATSKMANPNAAKVSGTFDVVIHDTTVLAIDNLQQLEGFSFYPNPVTNVLKVSAQSSIESLQIVNMLGQVVKTAQPNMQTYNLDMSSLATGVYFIKASVNNVEGTFRIVKQ